MRGREALAIAETPVVAEKQKKDIEAQLANGSVDASEIEKLSSKFSFISNSIDEKTMRWLELQD